ncbi:MAG: hypothetical protein BWK73_44290 [Thiothrix lacustris]|uniref:Uncharacterized protein n=1 Tax=Thiothrix lacustris TaxID=525917 RepID=A0A1Y1QB96_9GAMM|nr:MAG: hypothetical protein BWK73_44290 [Thiothrix lacustris]
MKKTLLAVATAMLLSNAVMAADVESVASVTGLKGSAVVARGDASLPLKQGMTLLEGDKVAVLDNSTLDLAYADCAVSHQQNTTVSVSAAAPCALGNTYGVGAASAAAGGSLAGIGLAPIVAGILTVGIIADAANDDSPNSP